MEKRESPRIRALKEGKAVLSDWTAIDCTIRDLAKGGARLKFGAPTKLPEEFRLLYVSSNVIVPVRVVWNRGESLGVSFSGPPEQAPPRKW